MVASGGTGFVRMLGEKPYLPGNAPCAKVLGMIAEKFEMFMCTCAAVRFVHAAELELQFSSSQFQNWNSSKPMPALHSHLGGMGHLAGPA